MTTELDPQTKQKILDHLSANEGQDFSILASQLRLSEEVIRKVWMDHLMGF